MIVVSNLLMIVVFNLLMFKADLIQSSPVEAMEEKKVCHYLGKEFQPGELVTGNPCDRCFCTEYGIMCEMMQCPQANCHDKVMKECCYECPNGPNCLYNGRNGSVLVPETGCTYTEGNVCYCYYDDKMADMAETYCLPALPGGSLPACNSTEI